MKPELPRLSVLFTDVTDSVGLYARHGDRAAAELVTTFLGVVEAALRDHGVRPIKRLGDAVLALASTPDDAVEGLLRARELLRRHPWFGADEICMRAAVTHGPAVLAADDVYGDIVNVAARLVGVAKPGEILLSEEAWQALGPSLQERTRAMTPMLLRGRHLESVVYEYVAEEHDTTEVVAHLPSAPIVLELRHGAASLEVRSGGGARIGRAEDNEIVVRDDVVSRLHAYVTLIGNHFVLTDRSRNGTYVRTASGEQLHARRGALTLSGHGAIYPGSERLEPIYYRVREPG